MKLSLAGLSQFDFFGVLLLRIGLGALAIYHGAHLLYAGNIAWEQVGRGAAVLTLNERFYWAAGLTAAIVQTFGGLFLVIGLFTRGSALSLAALCGIALANVIKTEAGVGLSHFAYAQLTLTFLALVFIGPGRLSFDRKGI